MCPPAPAKEAQSFALGKHANSPLFHAQGYNILAPDLRAHGEADGGYTTAGYYERHDLNQILDHLRAMRPNATKNLVLHGRAASARQANHRPNPGSQR